MDGQYLNKYKIIIQNWINISIDNKSWENFQEIHIDEIGEDFKKQQSWLEGGLFLLDVFNKCLTTDYKVLLIIELNYNKDPINVDKLDWEYLRNHISNFTPPAFYLFPEDDFRLSGTLKDLNLIDNFKEEHFKSYFKEEYDGDEHLVTIYLLK